MKTYEVVFDEKNDKGVYALSCVENPAMEDTWLTLSEHPKEIQFSAINDEKRLLLGAALIPNKKVYRNIDGQEFNIVFTEDTIEACAHSFIKNGFQNQSTENHEVKLQGVSVVQSWIVEDPELDKSKSFGKTYEKGTWVTMMKVDNDDAWGKAKKGELNGFSIDGLFSLKEMKLNSNKKEKVMEEKSLREKLAALLLGSKADDSKSEEVKEVVVEATEEVKVEATEVKEISKWETEVVNESFELGDKVEYKPHEEGGDPKAVSAGEFELEDGRKILTDSDGIIRFIKEAEVKQEEEKEEEKEEEAEEPVMEDAKEEEVELAKMEELKAELSKSLEESFDAKLQKATESFEAKLEEIKKGFQAELKAEKDKNEKLEAKLKEEPAEPKIVKTELKVAEPKTAKQRLLNVALEARNSN